MWAAIILAATAALIAALRPQRRLAVYTVLVSLGAAIWVTWSRLPEPSYAWLPALHLALAGRNDETARLAATLVATIAAVVAVFALGDPETNDGAPRFFATYALFVGAMLAFVSAGSIIFAYVCWEIMGVASFVLIGHDMADAAAGASARRALTATRLGDLAVLIGAALFAAGSLEAGASFVVVGAAVKSAQLGASPWLVGAMVAPTPVSALLHSATLVAAGPYLVARFIAFPNVPVVAAALLGYAAITALTSAIFAATSDDAKRTLAWSSIEQLAQAFVAAAVGMPRLALAVLAGHAIAKPALFFAAGMQRVATGSSRYATASRAARRIPSFFSAIVYGAIALVGIPPFLSSWALAGTWTSAGRMQPILLPIGVVLAGLGGWYVTRFGLLLLPGDARRFESRRIGAGSGDRRVADDRRRWKRVANVRSCCRRCGIACATARGDRGSRRLLHASAHGTRALRAAHPSWNRRLGCGVSRNDREPHRRSRRVRSRRARRDGSPWRNDRRVGGNRRPGRSRDRLGDDERWTPGRRGRHARGCARRRESVALSRHQRRHLRRSGARSTRSRCRPESSHLIEIVVAIVAPVAGAAIAPFVSPRVARRLTILIGLLVAALGVAGLVAGSGWSIDIAWIPSLGSRLSLGSDALGWSFVALSGAMTAAALAAVPLRERSEVLDALFGITLAGLVVVFLARDLLIFYVGFEIALVPTYFIIAGWGEGDRTRAALTFFLYTRFGSLAMLLGFVGLALGPGSHGFAFNAIAEPTGIVAAWIAVGLLLGFAVKLPAVPMHAWLPLAHTEAPTEGSIVLASLLLKLGGFGLIRIGLGFMPHTFAAIANWIIVWDSSRRCGARSPRTAKTI